MGQLQNYPRAEVETEESIRLAENKQITVEPIIVYFYDVYSRSRSLSDTTHFDRNEYA